MNEKLIILICEILLSGAVIVALVIILVAAWYDLQAAATKQRLQKISRSLNKPRQPSIAIIVYAHNRASSIQTCLESILSSRYVNYHLIVADHGSIDKTRNIVKKYRQHHKKSSIVLYSAKASTPQPEIIQRALKKLPTTDYSLVLDASISITHTTLRDVMAQYIANPRLTHLQLHETPAGELSIQTLVSNFFALSKNILFKALSVFRLLPRQLSDTITITRRQEALQQKPVTTYASNISYQQSSTTSGSQPPTFRLFVTAVIWLVLIAMVTYWMFTAAVLKSNIFLTLSWLAVGIWLLASIWSDDVTRLSKKIELTVSVPFMYFVFYLHIVSDFFIKIWQLINAIPFKNIARAWQSELYSYRY